MTFCFYVRNHNEFSRLKRFLQQKKEFFGEDWIFSQMETKPDYLRTRFDAPRNLQSVQMSRGDNPTMAEPSDSMKQVK